MNLIVAARHDGPLLRFEVEGHWSHGDALKLAYFIKANAARVREDHVLVDLRRVKTPGSTDERFLICDRLRRALAPNMRVGVVTPAELVDGDFVPPAGLLECADIGLFRAEYDAIRWLGRFPESTPVRLSLAR